MRNLELWHKVPLAIVASLALAAAVPGVARAGHGGSPAAIQQAIAANSVDAIQAELERAEHLVCAACVDLVTPLVDHPDARVRRVAAWWLARRAAGNQVQVAMLNRLSQSDSTAARNAADVLGEMHSPSSVPALGAALSNPTFSPEARAAMAQALGTIGRPACAAHLTAALGDEQPKVRAAALVALRSIPGFRDGSVAAPLVGDADETVRAEAAVTIATFRYAGGADALVAALNDPSANVRKKAAWALGAVHAPSSVAGAAVSNAASNDSSAAVRSLAHIALSQLSAN
ncbi:MAG: HEAT repeat domain-containing protein [Pseudomonadota bacterium]